MIRVVFKYIMVTCVALVAGCYSPQRDLSIDPYNTPLIHMLDASFDAGSGRAVVQWEYLGEKPVQNFVLQRRDEAVFRNIERVDGADANSQYATVGSFQDTDLFAGERLQYRVVAEHTEGGSVHTDAVEVSVPGAGLREIRRDPVGLAVQVVWADAGANATAYEVVRTPSGRAAETVFVTNDVQQSAFWDRSITDNLPYAYEVRSRLANGIELTSRSASVQFYRESGRHLVETLRTSSERMRLAAAELDGTADLLAVVGRGNQVSLSRLRHTVNVNASGVPSVSRRLIGVSFPQLANLEVASLDLAGPPLTGTRVVFPRAYIGGVDASGRVQVVGISLVQNTIVWQMPDTWESSSDRVRLAHDEQQRVYVATAGQLRVYSSLGFQLGAVDLVEDTPLDIAVQNNVIWVAWSTHVQRGVLNFSGNTLGPVVWQDVLSGAQPQALTVNGAGQAFVLDGNRIRLLEGEGTELMSWVVPSGSFANGDLTAGGSTANLIHLSNAQGEVITYVP